MQCKVNNEAGHMMRQSVGWMARAVMFLLLAPAAMLAAAQGTSGAAQGTDVRNAVFVSQNVPNLMVAGRAATVSVTFRNTGTAAWTAAQNYRLGSQNPPDSRIWGSQRIFLDKSDSVGPGQEKTFTFTVTPPATPGTYNFQWRMVQEEVEWFGESSPTAAVTVKASD
jgi:hypothetical protein